MTSMDQKSGSATAAPPPPARQGKPDTDYKWTQLLVLAFLTFNSVTAVYRSHEDLATVAFIVVSYLDLILLFYCLRLFEKTQDNPSRRSHLKVAIWTLSTLLTVMFSYRVAAIMPTAMKVIVWAMAGASVSAGFYAFFLYRDAGYKAVAVTAGDGSITDAVTTKGLP